jgi:hypothetical protein
VITNYTTEPVIDLMEEFIKSDTYDLLRKMKRRRETGYVHGDSGVVSADRKWGGAAGVKDTN